MSYVKNLLLLIAIPTLFASCAGRIDEGSFAKVGEITTTTDAVVFTKVQYKGLFGGSQNCHFELLKLDDFFLDLKTGKEDRTKARVSLATALTDAFNPWASGAHSMLVLEPGIYVIEKINFSVSTGNGGTVNYCSSNPGLADGRVMYGAFVAHRGDVVYLGDLSVKVRHKTLFSSPEFTLVKKDRISEVKKRVMKKNPALAERLQPTTFFGKGTPIWDLQEAFEGPDGWTPAVHEPEEFPEEA
jgi:hypothetical protein